jgi:hypothetical protein
MITDEEIMKFIEDNEEYLADLYKTYGKSNLDEYYFRYMKEKKNEDIKIPSNVMLPGNLTNLNMSTQIRPQFMPRMPMYPMPQNTIYPRPINPMQQNQMQFNPLQSNPMQLNPTQSNTIQSNPMQSNSMQMNPMQAFQNNMLLQFQNQMLRNPLIHQMLRNPQAMRLITPPQNIPQSKKYNY